MKLQLADFVKVLRDDARPEMVGEVGIVEEISMVLPGRVWVLMLDGNAYLYREDWLERTWQ